MAAKKNEPQIIELKPIEQKTICIELEGVTPLIVHAWSEKAKRQMLNKQMKKAAAKKEAKNPEEDYEQSLYKFKYGSGYGFPAPGFKAAIVGACRLFDGLPMTQAKLMFFIEADGEGTRQEQLVRIHGEPEIREDMVRLEKGVADIRYRGMFRDWSADLTITFNTSNISPEQLVNLVDAAGLGGIGEWRPSAPKSSTGDFGRFKVKGIKA